MILLRGHRKPVQCLAFSPDCTLLASSGVDRINVWDAGTAEVRWSMPGDYCSRVVFSPHGQLLAALAESLGVYRVSDGRPVRRFRAPANGFMWPAFSPDGKELIAITASSDFESSFVNRFGTVDWVPLEPIKVARDEIECVAFEPDGRRLATISKRVLSVWNARTRKRQKEVAFTPKNVPLGIEWAPDGQFLVYAAGPIVSVRDGRTLVEVALLKQPQGYCLSVAFHPDGRTLATTGKDGIVRFFTTATWKQRRAYDWHLDGLRCVAFAPDGLRAACGGDKGKIVIWDLDD